MKPQQMAEKILNHFNLQKYLVEIVGMDDNNNRSKADNIQTILSSFSFTDEDVVMIGDTMHDLNGAKKMDILFVPVSYGYGFSKDKPILVNGKEVYPIDKPNMLSSLIVENKI